MDYTEEMLRLYFKEMNYSKEKIDSLLNSNPFNRDYVIWEKQKLNNIKTFGIQLKRNNFIRQNDEIQEISIHENNLVSKYLYNDCEFTKCSINDNINGIRTYKKLVLVHGYYNGLSDFIIKLNNRKTPFITGISTKNSDYYNFFRKKIFDLKKEINSTSIYEVSENNVKTLILRSK